MPSESHEKLKQSFKNYDKTIVKPRTSITKKTGTTFAETGTYDGRVLLDKMYGMSVQDDTPTPSVPVAIKSAKANFTNRGKNLLITGTEQNVGSVTSVINSDGSVTINCPSSSSYCEYRFYDKNQGFMGLRSGTYKVFCEILGGTNTSVHKFGVAFFKGNSYVREDRIDNAGVFTFTLDTESESYDNFDIVASIGTNNTATDWRVRIMVTIEDETEPTYEFPQNQSITTDLTLRAIEVTSSDDYNLVRDGHYYIADTLEKIDGGCQITRRVDEITVDGSENWVGTQTHYFQLFVQNKHCKFLNTSPSNKSLSDHFVNAATDSTLRDWGGFVVGDMSGELQIVLYDKNHAHFANRNALQEWLATNNAKFYYVMATPTTETVTNADAKKLLSLKTYDEATYVAQTEDVEGQMTIAYGSSELCNDTLTALVNSEQNDAEINQLKTDAGIITEGAYGINPTGDTPYQIGYGGTLNRALRTLVTNDTNLNKIIENRTMEYQMRNVAIEYSSSAFNYFASGCVFLGRPTDTSHAKVCNIGFQFSLKEQVSAGSSISAHLSQSGDMQYIYGYFRSHGYIPILAMSPDTKKPYHLYFDFGQGNGYIYTMDAIPANTSIVGEVTFIIPLSLG